MKSQDVREMYVTEPNWLRNYAQKSMQLYQHAILVSMILLVALLLTACGPSPTLTPVPTTTSQPTAILRPTVAPSPTAISSPTPLPLAEWVKEGDALLQQSDFAGAEAAYQRVVEADAGYHPAYIGLSRVYLWQTGREDDALIQAQKAVELAPDSAAAYAVLARVQVAQLAPSEAVAAGEKAAELDGRSAIVQAALARAYLLDRQYEAAQQSAEQAIALDPELAEAYHSLGVYYQETADFARARASFQQAIALEPAFAPWYVSLGDLWSQTDDQPGAIAQYQQALELAPGHIDAILGLAYVAIERNDHEEAEAQIQHAIELVPDAPDAYVAWGYLRLEQDEPDEALAQFRQALAKKEEDWFAQSGIGQVHLQEEECDSAARQFQELMAMQPRFAAGRVGMGFAKLCSGDVNKALEYFRKALEQEPCSAAAQMGLGQAYSLQGRWEEATSAYVQALRFSATGADIHTYQGLAFILQEEVDSAKAEYQVALQLDADSVQAHVGLSEIFLLENQNHEAQVHAEQALSLEESNQEARLVLGIALIAQRKAKEAAEVLEQVVKEEPENALGHFYLGLAYRDLEQYAQAKKELETYLALEPLDPDQQRIALLIQALDQGYHLTEDKAISDLIEALTEALETETDIQVEQIEGDRTMVISLAVDPGQEQQELILDMSIVAVGAALLLPRIDPPIENGILIHIERKGLPMFTAKVSLSDMREYADGAIALEEFVTRLQFSRATPTEGPAPVEEIEADISEFRGLDTKAAIPYHPLTSDDIQEYMADSMDARTRQMIQANESLLIMLGVISPDVNLEKLMTDLYTEQIAGFYDSEEQTMYVIESKEQTAWDQMTIAHEYTHALQDQHFDLKELTDENMNADQRRALDALVEGDATLTTLLYAMERLPVLDLLQSIPRAGGLEGEILDTSPTFIRGMEVFPYQEGLTFVAALYESGGWAAVNRAYDDPPQSTEQILHPERYREEDEPQVISLPDITAKLGSDWNEVENDVLGELGLRLALVQHVGPAVATMAAEGWAGDRYALLRQGPEGPYVLVMRTYWDDQDEADEFWTLYRISMAHRAGYSEDVRELVGVVQSHWWLSEESCVFARQQDRYVTIVIGPDMKTVSQILTAMEDLGMSLRNAPGHWHHNLAAALSGANSRTRETTIPHWQ